MYHVHRDMSDSARKIDQIDAASTARINRRQTVLAQIEAALLANKLSVLQVQEERTGTDPYNSHRPASGPWAAQTRR
jgi:hypothetical protein